MAKREALHPASSTARPWILPVFAPQQGCGQSCIFCNQTLLTGRSEAALTEHVFHEQVRRALSIRPRKQRSHCEIGFYGGDFTGLSTRRQEAVLGWTREYIRTQRVQAIRISCRPDSVDGNAMERLWNNDVRTVELGVQSLIDDVLEAAGRGYGMQDVAKAVDLLRRKRLAVGFHLMAGLPQEQRADWQETLRRTAWLRPDFVRIHPTLVLQDTPLARHYDRGVYRPLRLEEAIDWCTEALLFFEAHRIPVTRVGLQPTPILEAPGAVVSGPFHPALRELVESKVFMHLVHKAVTTEGKWTLGFHPADLGAVLGRKHERLRHLEAKLPSVHLSHYAEPGIPRGDMMTVSPAGKARLWRRTTLANETLERLAGRAGAAAVH
jgi:histone acetyltransferase (RNA polymerase elongator complex component)